MSEPAVSIAFFDPAHGLHGTARAGATILFEGTASKVLPDGPEVERRDGGWHAQLAGAFSLELEPVTQEAALAGVTAHLCRVSGTVGDTAVSCLGTVGETATPPAWDELDALRSISAVFDPANALLAVARRPRGAHGHGQEEISAWLLRAGEAVTVDDARLSTVYDGEGRQRSAGAELWIAEQDFPRRCSGTVVAGSSLQLEGIDVHVAVFRWRMDEREGLGAYELAVRRDEQAA